MKFEIGNVEYKTKYEIGDYIVAPMNHYDKPYMCLIKGIHMSVDDLFIPIISYLVSVMSEEETAICSENEIIARYIEDKG